MLSLHYMVSCVLLLLFYVDLICLSSKLLIIVMIRFCYITFMLTLFSPLFCVCHAYSRVPNSMILLLLWMMYYLFLIVIKNIHRLTAIYEDLYTLFDYYFADGMEDQIENQIYKEVIKLIKLYALK